MVLNISFFIWTINVGVESSLFNLVSNFYFCDYLLFIKIYNNYVFRNLN